MKRGILRVIKIYLLLAALELAVTFAIGRIDTTDDEMITLAKAVGDYSRLGVGDTACIYHRRFLWYQSLICASSPTPASPGAKDGCERASVPIFVVDPKRYLLPTGMSEAERAFIGTRYVARVDDNGKICQRAH